MNPVCSNACLRRRAGNALVEFALAFALIFPSLLGCVEFGFAFYQYQKLLSAVRSGAAYASRLTYTSHTEIPSPSFLRSVRNMVVYGDPDGGDVPLVPGLRPEDVVVEVEFEMGYPRWVTVGIGEYRSTSPIKTLQFRHKPRLRMPYLGRFDPMAG